MSSGFEERPIFARLIALSRNHQHGKCFKLCEHICVIGRNSEQCHIRIYRPEVSSLHTKITVDEHGVLWVENLSRTNPTFLNGEPVVGSVKLSHKDIIGIGTRSFLVSYPSENEVAVVASEQQAIIENMRVDKDTTEAFKAVIGTASSTNISQQLEDPQTPHFKNNVEGEKVKDMKSISQELKHQICHFNADSLHHVSNSCTFWDQRRLNMSEIRRFSLSNLKSAVCSRSVSRNWMSCLKLIGKKIALQHVIPPNSKCPVIAYLSYSIRSFRLSNLKDAKAYYRRRPISSVLDQEIKTGRTLKHIHFFENSFALNISKLHVEIRSGMTKNILKPSYTKLFDFLRIPKLLNEISSGVQLTHVTRASRSSFSYNDFARILLRLHSPIQLHKANVRSFNHLENFKIFSYISRNCFSLKSWKHDCASRNVELKNSIRSHTPNLRHVLTRTPFDCILSLKLANQLISFDKSNLRSKFLHQIPDMLSIQIKSFEKSSLRNSKKTPLSSELKEQIEFFDKSTLKTNRISPLSTELKREIESFQVSSLKSKNLYIKSALPRQILEIIQTGVFHLNQGRVNVNPKTVLLYVRLQNDIRNFSHLALKHAVINSSPFEKFINFIRTLPHYVPSIKLKHVENAFYYHNSYRIFLLHAIENFDKNWLNHVEPFQSYYKLRVNASKQSNQSKDEIGSNDHTPAITMESEDANDSDSDVECDNEDNIVIDEDDVSGIEEDNGLSSRSQSEEQREETHDIEHSATTQRKRYNLRGKKTDDSRQPLTKISNSATAANSDINVKPVRRSTRRSQTKANDESDSQSRDKKPRSTRRGNRAMENQVDLLSVPSTRSKSRR